MGGDWVFPLLALVVVVVYIIQRFRGRKNFKK